jgi:aspartate--ammonia ligase
MISLSSSRSIRSYSVLTIVAPIAVSSTSKILKEKTVAGVDIGEDVYFITSQELLDMYPDLPTKEREYRIVKEKKAVFLMQIGKILSNNTKHDGRSPDYDDFLLNGDILVYNPVLDIAFELSSMGIRVNKESLINQLTQENKLERVNLEYHQLLLNDKLPLTIGGGIGQSRMCMYFLNKKHIGEVQSSYWPEEIREKCIENYSKMYKVWALEI